MTTIDRAGASPLPYSSLPTRKASRKLDNQTKDEAAVRLAFASPGGREALAVLEKWFDLPPVCDPDPYRAYYVEGGRRVIASIRECIGVSALELHEPPQLQERIDE